MSTEITIVLKDSERTYKHEFLIYEDFSITDDDPVIQSCVDKAKENFKGEPEDITLRLTKVLK